MDFLKRFFGHLKTVLTHKHWVLHYASRLGITWQGIIHDLSKLSPTEFFEGVKYWDGKRSPVLVAKEKAGISYAWLHHRGRNKHHYEYWIEKLDFGGVPHKIPFKCVVEIICDWLAAGRTYNGITENLFQKEYDWWKEREPQMKIHQATKELITKILWNLSEYEKLYGEGDWSLESVRHAFKYWEKMYNKEKE